MSGSGRRLVVEADGGSRGNPGPAGYGALVRDGDTGELLAEIAESIGTATNNVAEYRGLLAGLRAAVAIDPLCSVSVRMDSKLVVEQMSGRWQIKHEDMRSLAREARAVLPPGRVTYAWIPRNQNSHADRLANEAMDAAAAGRSWVRRELPGEASAEGEEAQESGSVVPSSTRAPRGPDVGPPTTLVLVRHGRTELTEQRRFSGGGGRVDPPLSPAGEADAQAAADYLARLGTADSPWRDVPRPEVLVCSPMQRTRQTAAAVGSALRLPVSIDERWVEASFGEWDGLTFGEIARRWPVELGRWQGSTTVEPPGGGESLDAVVARIRAARARTVAEHPGRVVAVLTHVTPIRAVVQEALDAGPASLWRLSVDPCSVTVVRFWADGPCEVVTTNAQPR